MSDNTSPPGDDTLLDKETRIRNILGDAEELKSEGNDHFRASRWDEALISYRTAIGRLPKRRESKVTSQGPEDVDPSPEADRQPSAVQDREGQDAADKVPVLTPLEVECAKARAVLNANIGACYVKMGNHKEAVEACTQAILDDPHYVRALQRRAASNEKLNTWSSLTNAQEDYTTLLKLLPDSYPQCREAERSLNSLKPRIEAAQKAETTEMLNKLKSLGNSILGNFGLSTDNFKFEPNGQGGYSVNFSR